MTSHDNSYKLLFSHAEMVRDLLLGFVKEEWVRDLDFQTLEKVGSSYVSDDIRDRHDDIVWRVKWGKDWLYVQTKSDRISGRFQAFSRGKDF